MEPSEVLKRFLDVCTNKDDKCTKHSFASNGVLEWFGRNIKDNNKIFEYIRYNLSHQYEHIFSVAVRRGAFEEKPLHKATRLQLPETMRNANKSKSVDIFETPPSCSKEATDDMATPERKIRSADSNVKNELSDTDEEKTFTTSPRITRSSRKRSSNETHPNSPSKRNKSDPKAEIDQLNTRTETAGPDLSNSTSHTVEVSELKYIEAIGTVRKLRKLKHRGIDSRSKDIRIYESPTRQHWDVENTKLKISYRENVNQSDIQFVLVIYQHIENNPRCRRDLMTEFAKTCPDESQSEPQKGEKKGKTNKCIKMRRLRF